MLKGSPEYLLRSPDAKVTAFPETLGGYTNVGPEWVELRPGMSLRIENAYYRQGAPKRGLQNYLGTETARYRVRSDGSLRRVSLEALLPERPPDQAPVQDLLPENRSRLHHHRYFYQVIFKRSSGSVSAILLSAESTRLLDQLTRELLQYPESVCHAGSRNCTMFPEACTVTLEMEILANGAVRTLPWGSTVAQVSGRTHHVELLRPYGGRLTPVQIDATDAQALRLPLLPGDRLTWQ